MSDLERAEELLKKLLVVLEPGRPWPGTDQALAREAIKEYFKKPVVIKDWEGSSVELSIDDEGSIEFDWVKSYEMYPQYFAPEELVRGLKELGVIE